MRSAALQTGEPVAPVDRSTSLAAEIDGGLPDRSQATEAGPHPQGARELQRLLEVQLPHRPHGDAEPAPVPTKAKRPPAPPLIRRAGKALIGAVLVAVFGIVPFRTLLQTSSVEAVVNARVVTLRAPIAGEVAVSPADLVRPGIVQRGTPLLDVVDNRADSSRLDDLQRQLAHLGNERAALQGKLAAAKALGNELARQAELFRQGRIAQLAARSAELRNIIEVGGAQRDEAVAARTRAAALSRSGSVSTAELDRLTRAATIATQTEAATRNRLAAANVELEAAREGVFIGDSYNDRPSSMQRADEIRQQVAGWTADLASFDAEEHRLVKDVAGERERYDLRSKAKMSLPVAGRIWEVLVSPGEQVRVGQDLVRVLDCSTALVTANVTESVYNRLRMGNPARFVPADGGDELAGTVVGLAGQAGAPANLAIEPATLSKEPHRVTVAVPNLDAQQACSVGRTGRVVFGDGAGDVRS